MELYCLRCNGMKGQKMVKFSEGKNMSDHLYEYACPECGLQVGVDD